MEPRLVDMHCHLDRILDATEVAAVAEDLGLAILCTPVTPADTRAARDLLGGCANVRVGAGLHPWWIDSGACGEAEAGEAADLAAASRFVGEVGLDFGRVHGGSAAAQTAAFERIVAACAAHPLPGRVLSIHAVHSAGSALDVLERFGLVGTGGAAAAATCVFHWFSGTSEELVRARRLGCLFSVNPMMLATRRGREYARQIPEDRLLLETDAPPGLDTPYAAADIAASLEGVLDTLAEIRRVERGALASRIAHRGAELLAL
ncbi:MAG: TatD family deoxyribonuclease [Coriobacteriaceae bacterium]|nr:TatD family deoxyribonuclease [Coriobacteriaceae bacterium]